MIKDNMFQFNGLPVTVTTDAMEETDERLFPASKNRSRRIHKKLVKRFGGEFRKAPCIWNTSRGLIMHPVMYDQLKREVQIQLQTAVGTHGW